MLCASNKTLQARLRQPAPQTVASCLSSHGEWHVVCLAGCPCLHLVVLVTGSLFFDLIGRPVGPPTHPNNARPGRMCLIPFTPCMERKARDCPGRIRWQLRFITCGVARNKTLKARLKQIASHTVASSQPFSSQCDPIPGSAHRQEPQEEETKENSAHPRKSPCGTYFKQQHTV